MSLIVCDKRRSVLEADGHCLVMGGPGCGKTTLALMKAAARLGVGLLPGQRVLSLSFSRSAVKRIADAAETQMEAGSHSALSIQTFHSFFWQILQGYGYLLGCPRAISIVLAHDEKAMRSGIERDSPEWEAWEASRLKMFYEEGRVCFDLFAPLTAEILACAKTVRDRVAARYPLILVDEAQDTGEEQWKCVELLAEKSQVICLADPDQMIYDFLPGVGPARIGHIRKALTPLEVDFGTENNRSPGTEIAAFARDILLGNVKGSGYTGVSRLRFQSSVTKRDSAIRSSIGIIHKRIIESTGAAPKSIVLIASYGRGVGIITSALQKEKPIRHQVLFDEAFALLAARVVAFLLEPKDEGKHQEDTAALLELVGAAFRAKGGKTALERSRKCADYARKCRAGQTPTFRVATAASDLVAASRTRKLTGNPNRDWLDRKHSISATGEPCFTAIAISLDQLYAFARGGVIREALSSIWLENAAYIGARKALDTALAQEQLLSAGEELHGIHVMNMHKCKGKQFDGVILFRDQYSSPFVWYDDKAPYAASRRLLHMAITRARQHLLILDEAASKCPILHEHTL